MVAQTEQSFLAIAHGNVPTEPVVRILEYGEMQAFFVEADRDAP
jgi:hypothetical protein